MDRCPPEIWGEIYAFACTDDGWTGRALSLVSRLVNQRSQPYKLQSVAVMGYSPVVAFADLLECTPPLRRVKCILISPSPKGLATGSARDQQSFLNGRGAYMAVVRILRAIAPSVKVLHALYMFPSRYHGPSGLLPVSLPVLEELVLYRQPRTLPSDPPSNSDAIFVSLKRLRLTFPCRSWEVFDKAFQQTPNLTHLFVRASFEAHEWLSHVAFPSKYADGGSALPPLLEKICIQTPTKTDEGDVRSEQNSAETMRILEGFAERDARVVLLPPPEKITWLSLQEVIAMWTASADGQHWW